MGVNKLKMFLNDAMLLAVVTFFSYFLFLLGESGRLHAFGLESSGLIPLRVQAIIPSVMTTIIFGTTLIVLTFFVLILSRKITRRLTKNRHKPIKLLIECLIMSIPLAPALLILWHTHKALFALYAIVTAAVQVSLYSYTPSSKVTERIEAKFDRWGIKKPSGRLLVLSVILMLMTLPIYAFSFGFIEARSQRYFRVVEEQSSQYVVVRQYDDRIILAQLEGDILKPNYQIRFMGSGDTLNFKIIRNPGIKFEQVTQSPF